MRSGLERQGIGRIGAISALVLSALAATVIVLATGSEDYEVTAVFNQVNGLIEGGEVTAGSLPVGTVKRISLGRDGFPRVRMRVSGDFRLREGATARVRPVSVSGEVNRFVELNQGDGAELPAGAVIDRDRTDQVVEFDQVLSTLDPETRREVGAVFERFDQATTGRGPDIERTLRRSAEALGATADLAAQLNSDGAALRALVSRGRQVVAAVERDPGSLGGFADRTGELLRTTAARQRDLGASVALMPPGITAGREALDRLDASVEELRSLVRNARPGIRELRTTAPELRRLMSAGRPALAEVDTLARRAPADLRRIDPLLRTARPVLGDLVPALERALPILNQARARLPDAFGFFTGWADFFSVYDANGNGGRVGLVFADTPRRALGSADSTPGRLELPFLRDPGVLEGEPWRSFEDSFLEVEE